MQLTATFLDEISVDIPHANWGPEEWDRDFQAMKAIGIDTVFLIRCGFGRWITYPSQVLEQREGCYHPPLDLVDLFLTLAEKYDMAFWFGTYDSARYWLDGQFRKEVDINLRVVDEVWERYGHRKAFKGWYLSQEVSHRTGGIIGIYSEMGRHCKEISANLPTAISPWIHGVKSVSAFTSETTREQGITLEEHERDWDEIMGGIAGAVDIVAFQDGHVEFHELADFLKLNKKLAERHGLHCWTNSETFDRDMPIKFFPIKWEKLLLKLEAAKQAGMEKGITFEFSHFMSPNSIYQSAHGLYKRYCEHFGLQPWQAPGR